MILTVVVFPGIAVVTIILAMLTAVIGDQLAVFPDGKCRVIVPETPDYRAPS